MQVSPATSSAGRARSRSTSPGTASGRQPPFDSSPPRFTSTRTRARAPAFSQRFAISRPSSSRSTVWTSPTFPARYFTLLVWSEPMKCQVSPGRSASASAFSRHSWT